MKNDVKMFFDKRYALDRTRSSPEVNRRFLTNLTNEHSYGNYSYTDRGHSTGKQRNPSADVLGVQESTYKPAGNGKHLFNSYRNAYLKPFVVRPYPAKEFRAYRSQNPRSCRRQRRGSDPVHHVRSHAHPLQVVPSTHYDHQRLPKSHPCGSYKISFIFKLSSVSES